MLRLIFATSGLLAAAFQDRIGVWLSIFVCAATVWRGGWTLNPATPIEGRAGSEDNGLLVLYQVSQIAILAMGGLNRCKDWSYVE